jgi:ribosome-binding factor A
MEGKRNARVAELLKQILSETISREMRDPSTQLVTITKVKITDDLRDAKVYFSKMAAPRSASTAANSGGAAPHERDAALDGLNRAKNFLRSAIAQKAGLRVVPSLMFIYDDTLDYAANIDQLLRRANRQQSDS